LVVEGTMLIRLLDTVIEICHCRGHGHSRLSHFPS
jgi:hypothetical protein